MKSEFNVLIAAFLALIIGSSPAFAANETMMDLLKVLRDKGTLTQNEYELLVNASKADKEHIEAIKRTPIIL